MLAPPSASSKSWITRSVFARAITSSFLSLPPAGWVGRLAKVMPSARMLALGGVPANWGRMIERDGPVADSARPS